VDILKEINDLSTNEINVGQKLYLTKSKKASTLE
jgi:LysM repeat protein